MLIRKNNPLFTELEHVRKQSPTLTLTAEAVVDFAIDPKTKLHAKFEWDNELAGHKYRLHQAQYLIRATVIHEPKTNREIRAHVSIESERGKGIGYRAAEDVIASPRLMTEHIDSILRDIMAIQLKYKKWSALARPEVIEAMDTLYNLVKTESNVEHQRTPSAKSNKTAHNHYLGTNA